MNGRAPHYLWQLRPYMRQVAGELVLGSLSGIVMNTAVVLPAILLGRAIDTFVAFHKGHATSHAVIHAAILLILGTIATEGPRIGKRGTPGSPRPSRRRVSESKRAQPTLLSTDRG